jgi:hypothetical protein
MALREKNQGSITKDMIDMTGHRHGKLVVKEFIERKNNNTFWKCICDCGKEHIASVKNLRSGSTISCGCKREAWLKSKRKGFGESSFNQLYKNYERTAKNKSLPFQIDKNLFKQITQQDCFYCGCKPLQITKNKSGYGNYIYNGVDRINNNLGYIDNNIVPCCTQCNTMKMDYSMLEFTDKIRLIYKRFCDGA